MKKLILSSALIVAALTLNLITHLTPYQPPLAEAQSSCTRHASTQAQIDKFIVNAQPGQTLCIADGTYSGIHIPPKFAGTASHPITIRALNDGKVLIDSGGSRAIDLQGSYGILEGINSAGADNQGFAMRGDHWIARRVMIWNNGPNHDGEIASMGGGGHNVLEDCAIWGHGRYIITVGAGGPNAKHNTVRRCWFRWEYRAETQSPDVTTLLGYNGQSYVTFENVIATMDKDPNSNTGHQVLGPLAMSRSPNSLVIGAIAYAAAGARYAPNAYLYGLGGPGDETDTKHSGFHDVVGVTQHGSDASPQLLDLVDDFRAGHNNYLKNIVGINVKGKGDCNPSAVRGCDSEVHIGETVAAVLGTYPTKPPTIYHAVPGICRKVVNRQTTNEPLWPWPMNQRLKDALVQSGRAPVDITAQIEAMLGPIPAECRGSGSPSPLPTPIPPRRPPQPRALPKAPSAPK